MEHFNAQVIVCGAGTAGLPAAFAAARQGIDVIIVEEDYTIGGSVADYGVQFFCGEPRQGIYNELINKINHLDPQSKNFECFHASAYVLAWQELLSDLPVRIFTGQKIQKVITENGKIAAVKTDNTTFTGDIFIDATGNAAVAAETDCEINFGRESFDDFGELFAPKVADDLVQMCTLMYSIRRRHDNNVQEDAAWAKFSDDEFLIWGPTEFCKNPLDMELLSQSTQNAFKSLTLQSKEWGDKGYFISNIAPKMGVRETRRIKGDYILSFADILAKREYEDSICTVRYPIDPWDPDGNPFHDTEKNCETPFYEIPYRCLVTAKVPNLLVAGRCISTTHVVNSSCRVMRIAMITGQAAGIAASIAVHSQCSTYDIDIEKLRETLERQGIITSLEKMHIS